MARKQRSPLLFIIIAAVVLGAAYFVNVEVQTRLGESALQATGLEPRSLPEASELAQQQGKPVFANLSAIWCPTCRSLDKRLFVDPEVKAALDARYVYSRIEYESEAGQAFAHRYGITGFPALLLLRPDGELIKQLPITTDPELFLQHL